MMKVRYVVEMASKFSIFTSNETLLVLLRCISSTIQNIHICMNTNKTRKASQMVKTFLLSKSLKVFFYRQTMKTVVKQKKVWIYGEIEGKQILI